METIDVPPEQTPFPTAGLFVGTPSRARVANQGVVDDTTTPSPRAHLFVGTPASARVANRGKIPPETTSPRAAAARTAGQVGTPARAGVASRVAFDDRGGSSSATKVSGSPKISPVASTFEKKTSFVTGASVPFAAMRTKKSDPVPSAVEKSAPEDGSTFHPTYGLTSGEKPSFATVTSVSRATIPEKVSRLDATVFPSAGNISVRLSKKRNYRDMTTKKRKYRNITAKDDGEDEDASDQKPPAQKYPRTLGK
jgi:hypothetical protein